jgi:hypothetical protein
MAEPPLETWVSDDITKEAVQRTGNINNDPEGQMKAAQVANLIEQEQQAHIQKLVAQAHEHERSEDLHAMELAKQQAIAAQEAYRVREAASKADLAARTAKEKRVNPPAKPKSK